MSRIGKKTIIIPAGVKIEQAGPNVKVSGPLGALALDCHPDMQVRLDSAKNCLMIENKHPEVRESSQMHGTTRALLANMVEGVSKGFEKKLEIYGTGYTVKEQGGKLTLQVGYTNATEMAVPKSIKVRIDVAATRGDDTPAKFTLVSADKRELGRFAADVRKVRPPEPYKGKGIRFSGEVVKRKVGKTFTSGTA
ncbi:MAG: 50S ribosomal protein L6 [Sedimentisphaerales bacterium]|nr:50S ribosomal protein L6 [Sedimentisphaerales bacterium]